MVKSPGGRTSRSTESSSPPIRVASSGGRTAAAAIVTGPAAAAAAGSVAVNSLTRSCPIGSTRSMPPAMPRSKAEPSAPVTLQRTSAMGPVTTARKVVGTSAAICESGRTMTIEAPSPTLTGSLASKSPKSVTAMARTS